MAFVALTSLIETIELQFLRPTPRVSLHDRAPIKSLFENLSSLQAFLQKESNGDDDGAIRLRDLEIQIRDFALKAEDDIEIQLSSILLAQLEDTEYREKASHELHQTLREAAKDATELLKIISTEKESCVSKTEMAIIALTILITKFKHHFLQPFPIVYLGDEAVTGSFSEKLSSLQACLLQGKSIGGAAIEIRNFALKAENDIEIQLSNFLQAKHTEHEEEASQQLRQTLQEAAEITAELLGIIYIEEQHEKEMEITCDMLAFLMSKVNYEFHFDKPEIKLDLLAKLSSLKNYLLFKKSSGCATINDLDTKIRTFALKAVDDIVMTEYSQLNRTLQKVTENANELLMGEKETEIAYVALSDLMGTIEECHDDEEFLSDVGKKSFLEKISSLQALLLKESSGGAVMKDLGTKIKDFALKAKDDIQIQVNHFLQANYKYKQKVTQELRHTMQEAAESAAELLKIINEVDDANKIQPSHTWLKHATASKSANVESDGSSHRFLKPEGRMVGRHHDCTVIKDQLFSSCSVVPKVISIVGMVGIGKTTAARNVYEDPSVASHFNLRGWVTIPQHYNKSQMLSDLLQSITPEEPNVIKNGTTPHELEMQVRKCLRGRKYLIVLDNIMSNQAWTDITQCLPNDIAGICILLTTSYFNQYISWNNYIHNMTLLDPNESWELFGNILSIEEHLALKFEKIRNRVVEKCDGLPQLIVEVAKRLSKCNNIQQGWKKIEKELESLGILDRNEIAVSYNPLPHHLKVCFLYFGVFPKRNRILVTMLIRLWIAEGFVMNPLEHKELEDQAYEYLLELIDRSLLLIEHRSFDGKIKTCRMHSAMHSFCVGEAQKEGILCAVNTQQHSGLSLDAFANSCRWLSLYPHSFDYYVLFGTNIPRSIFFFHKSHKMFVPLKLLRVLAFDTSIFLQRLPLHLGDLVFLRYLSITQWFQELDEVMSNNPNLQTLVVSGNGAPTVHLSSSIWKPPHLRHLELGNSYMVDPPSVDKKNLQTLSWVVRPGHCRKEMYSKFPDLKKLKIFLKDDIEPSHIGGCCRNPIILDHFDYLKGLEKLSISVSICCNAALPEQCMYPSGLKKLKLSGTNISERDLNVIAMLPRLMVLKLENAFHGTVWNTVANGGFPLLIFLLLEAKELEQWVVSFHHFLMLRHLVLRSCNCLEQVPMRFSWLKSIELKGCRSSLVASAKQLQQMRRSMHFEDDIEIKILGPEYDDSQNTHTQVSM